MAANKILHANHILLIFLLILTYPAQATLIRVNAKQPDAINDGQCSLIEAITAANTDQPVDTCPAGNGADIIQLEQTTYTLTAANNQSDGPNALPVIITEMTIQGIDTRLLGVAVAEEVIIRRDPGEVESIGFSPLPPDQQPGVIRAPAPPMRIFSVSKNGKLILKHLKLN
jgi:hypothetical protein